MKNFFSKNGVLIALILPLLLIFILGGFYSRFMTEKFEEYKSGDRQLQQQLLEFFPSGASITEETFVSVEKSYLKPNGSGNFEPILVRSFVVNQGTQAIGVVYIIESYGNKDGLVAAYAIDKSNDSVVGVVVLEHQETDTAAYYQKLDAQFFAQFNNFAFDTPVMKVDAIAGATYSSLGFEMGLLFAREQYAKDFGFEIPLVVMTLNSLNYNLNPSTFVEYPFIADITYGDDDLNVVCYLKNDFSFGELVSGSGELTNDEKMAVQSLASQSGISTLSYFTDYDAETRTVLMETKGYVATPIKVSFVLKADFSSIDSFVVNSVETYNSPYNEFYSGGNPPAVENQMINQYIDGVTIDTIAGASDKTEPAMRSLIDLLDLFIASLQGGE